MKPSRAQLEQQVIAAVLDLFGETGTDAFPVPIPKTAPPLFIAAGEAGAIRHLIDAREKAQLVAAPTEPARLTRDEWISEFINAVIDVRPDVGSKFARAVALTNGLGTETLRRLMRLSNGLLQGRRVEFLASWAGRDER